MRGDYASSQMVTETEAARKNNCITCSVLEVVVPDKLGIDPKGIIEDLDGIAITVASRELDDRYAQV